MLKVMFIDDDPVSIEDAVQILIDNVCDLKHWEKNFEEGREDLNSLRPDIVVLDIWKGDPQMSEAKGADILEFVWKEQFCPVIIYSADSKIIEDVTDYDHPFVEVIKKGSGSDESVLKAVSDLRPQVEALREGEETIRKAFRQAMKEVAPYAFANFESTSEIVNTVVRSGRRRVAALMDEPLVDESRLASWEQYLCPPVSQYLQSGDILKATDGNENVPTSFRVVLTPSCDMVDYPGRPAKVKEILVAKCCSMKEALIRTGLFKDVKELDIESRQLEISKHPMLSQGYFNAIIPFPGLKGMIPTMAANLRNLELIAIDELKSVNPKFRRVASIDSPFRELVSWAYLQVSCRPGLPDRDSKSWSLEIVNSINW